MQSMLGHKASIELIKKYRISLPSQAVAKSKASAIKSANDLGYPVVLKALSRDIVHKTDAGAVITSISSDKTLLSAYDSIIKNSRKYKKQAKLEGMLVQKMVVSDAALIVGAKRDPIFGDIVLVGSGGIYTEVIKDISMRICPITKDDAKKMLAETKIYSVLSGYRGKRKDIFSAASTILKLSSILKANKRISEIEINPLFVLDHDVSAADVRIISR